MRSLGLIGTAAAIHLLAVMSPGPNFVVISRNSLVYSRRSGMYTTVGVTVGVGILVVLGFLGVTAVVAGSKTAYNGVRLAGAAYLIVIGVRSLNEVRQPRRVGGSIGPAGRSLGPMASCRMGFITAMTNPKAAVYLLAFFTTLISVETPLVVKVALVIVMPTITFSWYSFMVWVFSQPTVRRRYLRFERWSHVAFGLLLIGLGMAVAVAAY